MILRRRTRFSAAIAGVRTGGRAHGHDYACEIAVSGSIDPVTGMVVNIKDIDHMMQSQIVRSFNHKLLDRDIPEFIEHPVTLEAIVAGIWRRVVSNVPAGCSLAEATLWESPTAWTALRAHVAGEDPVLSVTRAYEFSASHRLHSDLLSDLENDALFGKCNWENGHGHNYEVEITFTGVPDPSTGELVSPERLDRLVDEAILKPFDHRYLNLDIPEFRALVPTSENVTVVIWNRLTEKLAGDTVGPGQLSKVVVKETPRNHFEYTGPDSP